MFRDKFCSIGQNVHNRHRRTNSQFLKNVLHEQQLKEEVSAQEFLMTAENPLVKEQKIKSQICRKLWEVEREKFLEEKRKALLHQNEDEIRQLDVQIKRAHIQAKLAEQKAYNERKAKNELQSRIEENKRFQEECKKNAELAHKEEQEDAQKKATFRQDLLRQMEEKDTRRQMERELIKKDREYMKRFLENFKQDTENERQHALELKKVMQEDRDEYLRQVKLYKSQQQLDTQEDHRKYMEMMRQREEAKRLRIEKRRQYNLERAALSERIGQQVFNIEKEKEKRSDFLLELLIEERLAKDDNRYKMTVEKQLQTARSLRNDFQRSRMARHQEQLLKQEEEMNMAKEQLKIFQQQEDKELHTKHLNLLKSRQYCQDLLHTIENKNREREFEASQSSLEYKQQVTLQQKRQQEIEAEKLRLLLTEPLEVLKFLPVKAISDTHRVMLGLACKETEEKI